MPIATSEQRHRVNLSPQSDPEICLIEFWEDGSDYVIRAAVNSEDYVWNGETYTRSQIDVLLPKSGDQTSTAGLEASNVNRSPGQLALSAERRLNIRMIAVNTVLEQALIDTKTNFYAKSLSSILRLSSAFRSRSMQGRLHARKCRGLICEWRSSWTSAWNDGNSNKRSRNPRATSLSAL